MKHLLLAAIGLLLLSLNSFAQETFDITTFRAPNGWTRQASQDLVQYSISNNQDFCVVSLYRSVPGIGTPKENFDAAWDTIVKDAVKPSSAPEMLPGDTKGEWQVVGGYATFEKDGSQAVALLFTASGYGTMVNALVLTNTQAFRAATAEFLDSISFKKPAVQVQQPQAPAAPNGAPSLTNNFWKMGGVRQGMLGHTGLSTATFSKTYQFFSNGTYKFRREDFSLAAPKWYLENEEGTYTVSGNTITITSKRSAFSSHRINKEDPPLRSGNLGLSTAQYRFEFWLNDGNWALLLSPIDGNETKRDGTFSFYRNGEPQRTYQYVLVDAKGNLIR